MPLAIIATVFTTPLLKIPLLVSHAVCTYHGMTPPTQPPPQSEQKRFTKQDFMTRTTNFQLTATAAAKVRLLRDRHLSIANLLER